MSEEIKSLGDLEAVTGGSEAVVEMTAPREPKRDDLGRSYAEIRKETSLSHTKALTTSTMPLYKYI